MNTRIAALALLWSLPVPADQGFPVTTAPLEKVEVQVSLRAYGHVAERPQYLYFEVPGNLAKLNVDVGAEVTAGQVLAELDTRDVDNEVRQAEEGVKHAKIKYEQFRRLRTQEAASRDQLEDRRHEYELAQLQLAKLQEQHTKHVLRAPSAGRILDRLVDHPGPVASDTAIFQMRNADALPLVSADLTQREVAQVQVGDQARIGLPEAPDTPVTGHVVKIRPGSAGSGLFSVDVALDSLPVGVLLEDGMQVDVTIVAGEARSGYVLPVTALLSIDSDRGSFFVVDDQHAKAVTARLTRLDGDRVFLADDLSAYARVVVRGQYQLTDGAPLAETPGE